MSDDKETPQSFTPQHAANFVPQPFVAEPDGCAKLLVLFKQALAQEAADKTKTGDADEHNDTRRLRAAAFHNDRLLQILDRLWADLRPDDKIDLYTDFVRGKEEGKIA